MTHITFRVLSKTDPYLHWALLKSQCKIDPEGSLDLKVQCHQRETPAFLKTKRSCLLLDESATMPLTSAAQVIAGIV